MGSIFINRSSPVIESYIFLISYVTHTWYNSYLAGGVTIVSSENDLLIFDKKNQKNSFSHKPCKRWFTCSNI